MLERILLGNLIAVISSIVFIANPILCGSLFIVICWVEIVNLGKRRKKTSDIFITVLALLYMTLVLYSYVELCKISPAYVYQAILIAAAGDFSGFLAGSFIKKYSKYKYKINVINLILKLLAFRPFKVSPNKTVAGFIAVIFAALLVKFAYVVLKPIFVFIGLNTPHQINIWMIIVLGAAGQIGDLLESSMKRKFKVKDSSNLLGSHGGFCDRFDSTSFICIVLYSYFYYTGAYL